MVSPILTAAGLLLAGLGIALLRVFSGMKSGAFYAKCMHPGTKCEPYVQNLHRIEAPQWYVQFATFFVLVFLVALRGTGLYDIMYTLLGSYLLVQGASSAASYWYQAWINRGSGLPDVDPDENPKAEFALHAFGKDYSFWWSRPWYGKRRIWSQYLGFVMMAAGTAIICFR
jgi:hypothetical protein